jgi:CBS domain-containing protein
MKRNPQVVTYTTPFPYSIDVDAPLAEAHALVRKHHFRHLPVTSNQAIVGILTAPRGAQHHRRSGRDPAASVRAG